MSYVSRDAENPDGESWTPVVARRWKRSSATHSDSEASEVNIPPYVLPGILWLFQLCASSRFCSPQVAIYQMIHGI